MSSTISQHDVQSSAIHLRPATPNDAKICGSIVYEAFGKINHQHGFALEFSAPEDAIGLLTMLFSHPEFHCLIAEFEGRIVGSICMDERSAIGGVGPVTIAPDAQDCGIGRMLIQAIVNRSKKRSLSGIRLTQASYHNRSLSLYAKLGFTIRESICVMSGAPLKQRAITGYLVREAREGDVEAASQVCYRVHGHTRSGELRDAVQRGTALVVERNARITGYASGLGYLAHAVGESNLDIQALLCAAERFDGPGVLIPTRNSELFSWCLQNSMRVVYPFTLMTMGLYNEPTGGSLPSVLY
jgi:predicted N-acetyltransferase YhbS